MKARRLIDDSPATANMKVRYEVVIALQKAIETWDVARSEAAKRLGITQPRLSNLLRSRIEKFSLDALMNLTSRAGLAVTVHLEAASLSSGRPEFTAPALTVNPEQPGTPAPDTTSGRRKKRMK